MRCLITGVAGFIGSHILSRALQMGWEVVGIDNFLTGKQENLDAVLRAHPDAASHFHFRRGDIRNMEDCMEVSAGADVIIHEAAIGSVPWSIEDPHLTHETNVTGFLNLLNAARAHQIHRFVYASSSAVYGDVAKLPTTEDCAGHPLSPYAASKLCDEAYAAAFAESYGLQCFGLRYFNVFGPRQDPNGAYAAVIPRWIDTMKQGKRCIIFGDGSTSRDFCYVDNVVSANILAATLKVDGACARVCNVACGAETTLNELHDILSKGVSAYTGKPVTSPEYQDFRKGDILRSVADIHLAEQYIGYKPVVSVPDGLKETLDYFIRN